MLYFGHSGVQYMSIGETCVHKERWRDAIVRAARGGTRGTREEEAGEKGNKTDKMAEGKAEAMEKRSTKEEE